ncbi:hypothetical protein [Phormidium sp. CCY1219]|uniref:hypothetical protein n=1 Tax=Phormidium sp. CCY1219 TaxID=2886104 RepID=UPI002D1E5D52|nr:hypothetical protein [Phormidium sp. CCY1219]MEB3829585.1 hypothetical protein [Phormidium sp. CCY1219]
MKGIKKVAAGLLLAFGVLCLGIAGSQLLSSDGTAAENTDSSRTNGAMAAIGFGIPALAAGGWLSWGLYRGSQEQNHQWDEEQSHQLHELFFQMLQERNGQITVLHFAKESQLSGKQAQQFLDEKAKEFNADYEVSDRGDVIYRFKV